MHEQLSHRLQRLLERKYQRKNSLKHWPIRRLQEAMFLSNQMYDALGSNYYHTNVLEQTEDYALQLSD